MAPIPSSSEHPGQVLDRMMRQYSIDRRQLATAIDVDIMRLYRIIDRGGSITADTAMRLGLFFETGAMYWMNLQSAYDIAQIPADVIHAMNENILKVNSTDWMDLPTQNRARIKSSGRVDAQDRDPSAD